MKYGKAKSPAKKRSGVRQGTKKWGSKAQGGTGTKKGPKKGRGMT